MVERKQKSSLKEHSIKDPNQMTSHSSWKEDRIREINAMGLVCDDTHPYFEEVMEIYKSKAKSLAEFYADQERHTT